MRIRSSLLLVAAAVFALATLDFNSAALAQKVKGAIFTTDHCGNFVNGNIYDTASVDPTNPDFDCALEKGNYLIAPYLNGGPPPNRSCSAAGLPDGIYYFQVTDPSGKELLSTDSIGERKVGVFGGFITGYDGTHQTGIGKCPEFGNIAVELFPYLRTPNNGGEYKVWMTKVSDWACNAADPTGSGADCTLGGVHGFIPSKSKTDNFKVGDYDGDGIPDGEDACPDDPLNTCVGFPPPAISFDSPGVVVLETGQIFSITVGASETSNETVIVNYEVVSSSSATQNEDFEVVVDGIVNADSTGTLTFSPGEQTKDIQIQLIGDGVEDTETVVIQLTNPTNATLGTYTTFTLEIVDGGGPPPS